MKFVVSLVAVFILIGSLIGCAEAERLVEDIYVSDLYANNIGSATDEVQAGHFRDLYVDGVKWAATGGGAGLSYTELDGTAQTTVAGQGGGDGAWVAWDLSAIIGSGSEVVEIRIEKLVATDSVGVRKNGSGLAREFTCLELQSVILLVECDAGRVIEIQSDDVSDGDTFSVMGYWH